MQGYDAATYGEAFADVYDDWYADLGDVDECVERLSELAGTGAVLELGVGTGRLAIPLAAALSEPSASTVGTPRVHGLDSSAAMLQRMAAKPGGDQVAGHLGDMVDGLPTGPFSLAFAAYNTFFNLLDEQRQAACMAAVAARLAPGGRFVVEAFVPTDDATPRSEVAVRTLAVDRVVLAVSRTDPAAQRSEGQYVEFTEGGGVRLRPWSVRWSTPAQLDAMAAAAGLVLHSRHEDWATTPFVADSARHVSVYSTAHANGV